MRNINNITANLDRATQQLNSYKFVARSAAQRSELYNNLNNCAAHVDSILIDLRRSPSITFRLSKYSDTAASVRIEIGYNKKLHGARKCTGGVFIRNGI